ncbi:DUF4347 domain-containing protein [Anabaena sp. AL09]|uniref:DUF4347 domain-containing protein n=1 Tax=Anabaena sp. AL09 TaxID=1710891 RepID=UPI000AFB51B8|nr:DUF4347 domain-containing protein [Anabaena sp. AL09]
MYSNSFLRQTATTVVFIDASVSDYQTLQTGVIAGVETVILSPNQNGIEEITDFLRQHTQITTIHIVSHGSPGCLYLGNSQLNLDNISKYAELLQHWQSENILLYGCNVAAGDAGEEFITKLHEITNATISASATKTGNAALGGNWELEVNIPENHGTSLVFHAETLNTYQGVFAPTLVGVWDRLSYAMAVTVVGNYAYAVGNTLDIIDISNPSNPIFKGNCAIYEGNDIQIVGNYAYVADGQGGLKIIDISNPTAPTLKGNYDTSGSAYGVQVVGNYAYVADAYSGLQIIDISNPTAPTLKGNYDTSGLANGVQIVGNYAYIADGYAYVQDGKSGGLQIIDISNPTAPTLKGYYYILGNPNGVQVVGNYAYVAVAGKGLQIIDVSNPTNPTFKGNYDTSGLANGVQVVGNYAYVANGGGYGDGYTYSGLKIIDISNPTAPSLKGDYANPSLALDRDVQVVGNYAYVAAGSNPGIGGYSSELKIIDISTPTAPTLKGKYDISDVSANGVQVVGNYAYVAHGGSGLEIIDISNPTAPTLKGNYDTSGDALGVQVVGNYAYVADSLSGLQIIDISNPTAPTLKANYDTSGFASTVKVVGNYAYVADSLSGLQIIDISNPTAPTLKANYDTPERANGVQVVGNYAYVADDVSGLQIIDISNPTAPTLKGSYDTPGWAYDLQIVGNYAYVADGNSGLQIIDISNPTAPTLKGSYADSNFFCFTLGVQVVGNYAYVANGPYGVQIIDISNPTTPTLKGSYASYNMSDWASGVQVVGNYAYVSDGRGGLKIINVSEFTNQAPTNITLSNSNIAENQVIGTVVGNFTTTDPDANNTFTYSLVAGTGDTNNSVFTITNNQLTTNSVFDYETKNSYNIRVKTTDQGGLSFEKQLTIGVTDLNEDESFTTTAQQDIIDAEYGDDTITSTWANLQQNDTIKGGNGTDTLIISGGTVNDIISSQL